MEPEPGSGSDPVDRISGLPNNVIENILVRLPICNAVATSALSRKWRYKWVTIPDILFRHPLGKKLLGRGLLARGKFISAVNQVLLLHKGPIFKFALERGDLEVCPDLDRWISFLSQHDIQEFSLSGAGRKNHILPGHFFSFHQLRHLKLGGYVFRPPPTFRGFGKLVSLQLDSTLVEASALCSLISKSPLLERLMITGLTADSLEIHAPSLKLFSFHGDAKSICLKNTPLLEEVAISLDRLASSRNGKQQYANLINFTHPVPSIKKLCLGSYVLEILAMGGISNLHPIPLDNLEVLCLDEMDFSNLNELMCALSLIICCPKLEELKVVAFTVEAAKDAIVEFFRVQDFSHYSLNRLQKASIEEVSNFEPELEFIKLILASSPFLQEMEIFSSKEMARKDERRMCREVTGFRRSSPNAVVKFWES